MIKTTNKSHFFQPTLLALALLIPDVSMAIEELEEKKLSAKNAKKTAAAAKAPDVVELQTIKVVAKANADSDQDPNDPYNKTYTVTNSSTATKTDTPIIETPVSIQVVPKSVMSDQKATTIKDALENISSVRPQSSLGLSNAFITRGFRNGRVFRNGLVANGLGIGEGTQFDSANLERIEVLKGPAAVLFGRIEPGGLVNLVTKKPRNEPYYSVEQRFGSYNFYRTEWDATDAVSKDKSVSYRFTGAYQNNKSFRDFNFNDRFLVNPSLTWRPSAATEMSLEVEALDEYYQVDRGLFAIGNRPAPIPISRSFIDPNDPVDNNSKVNLGFNLTMPSMKIGRCGTGSWLRLFMTKTPRSNLLMPILSNNFLMRVRETAAMRGTFFRKRLIMTLIRPI